MDVSCKSPIRLILEWAFGGQTIRTLEFKLVLAAFNKLSLSLKSTGIDISSKYSTAFAAAFWKD